VTVYRPSRQQGVFERPIAFADDVMNWMLYGKETWLVALLKGVPLFIYVYFLLTYVPNYVYYLATQYIPFLQFSDDVGFLLAAMIGGGNFLVLIILGLWTQAARGRRGFAWSLVRILDLLQYLGIVLLLTPLLLFNLGGGTFVPTTNGRIAAQSPKSSGPPGGHGAEASVHSRSDTPAITSADQARCTARSRRTSGAISRW
jgi:hypothetical protein